MVLGRPLKVFPWMVVARLKILHRGSRSRQCGNGANVHETVNCTIKTIVQATGQINMNRPGMKDI